MSGDVDSYRESAADAPDPGPLSAAVGTGPDRAAEGYPADESSLYWLWLFAAILSGVVVLLGLALALALLRTKGPLAARGPQAPIAPADQRVEPSEAATASPEADTSNPPAPDRPSQQVCPESAGEIWLLPPDAALRGGVRQVTRGGQELLVGWSHREATAEWRFQADHRGVFRAEVTHAATAAAGAGKLVIEVDGEPFERTLSTTGDPSTFKKDTFFVLLRKGPHALVCRPLTPTRQGPLQLQSIRLSRLSVL